MAHADPADTAATLSGVTLRRGARTILDDVALQLPRGACTVLLGPNGCGKTSLTRVLTGHYVPTRGEATVLGQRIGACNVWALRRRVAVVNPTADSVAGHASGSVVDGELCALDAVLTGYFATVGLYDRPTAAQRDHAAHLLRSVGLAGHESQTFASLSTGEQRRCLIARALVHTPELLILDEPTAGLDVRGREQVLATLELLLARAVTTVLMITHHVEELPPSSAQLLLMREGRITHAGPPTDIITPESLSATFGCRVYVRRIQSRWWLEVLPEAWLDVL